MDRQNRTTEQLSAEVSSALRAIEEQPDTCNLSELSTRFSSEFAPALDAFRAGLNSSSADVQILCIEKIGEFASTQSWATEELGFILNDTKRELIIRSSALYALGRLETEEATDVLGQFIADELGKETSKLLQREASSVLAKKGALALKHRHLFSETKKLKSYEDPSHHNIRYSVSAYDFEHYTRQIREDFLSFLTSGNNRSDTLYPLNALNNQVEDLSTGTTFGKFQMALDEVVDLGNTRGKDLFTRVTILIDPDAHTNADSPTYHVILSQCEYTSYCGVQNACEDYIMALSGALSEHPLDIAWYTYCYTDYPSKNDYGISAVEIIETEFERGYGFVTWRHNSDELKYHLYGQNKAIGEYLRREAPKIEGLIEYTEQLRYDQRARTHYESKLFHSPEGSIHYDHLDNSFGKAVAQFIEHGVPAKVRKQTAQYNKQFNPAEFKATRSEGKRLKPGILHALKDIEQNTLCTVPDNSCFHPNKDRKEQIPYCDGAPPYNNELACDPLSEGVILLRAENPEHKNTPLQLTNIPWNAHQGSAGYGWHYTGSGPHELALNILNTFIPPGSDGFPASEATRTYWNPPKRTFTSLTARVLSSDFVTEVIAHVPANGGYLSSDKMKGWITAKIDQHREKFLNMKREGHDFFF